MKAQRCVSTVYGSGPGSQETKNEDGENRKNVNSFFSNSRWEALSEQMAVAAYRKFVQAGRGA